MIVVTTYYLKGPFTVLETVIVESDYDPFTHP
ncbi:hypothetical protein DESC_590135 [Desulfosarcina cetonica]|nr:hypothetical protein DESC_590135 [Desulfosarcina cetonica]